MPRVDLERLAARGGMRASDYFLRLLGKLSSHGPFSVIKKRARYRVLLAFIRLGGEAGFSFRLSRGRARDHALHARYRGGVVDEVRLGRVGDAPWPALGPSIEIDMSEMMADI